MSEERIIPSKEEERKIPSKEEVRIYIVNWINENNKGRVNKKGSKLEIISLKDLTPETRLDDSRFELDSLEQVEVVMDLEDDYKLPHPNMEVPETFGPIIDYFSNPANYESIATDLNN